MLTRSVWSERKRTPRQEEHNEHNKICTHDFPILATHSTLLRPLEFALDVSGR